MSPSPTRRAGGQNHDSYQRWRRRSPSRGIRSFWSMSIHRGISRAASVSRAARGSRHGVRAPSTGEGAADTFILPTQVEHLFLIPADRNLTGAEIEMVPMPDRERRLQRARAAASSRFEFIIFIDCPAIAGLLHAAIALVAGRRGADSAALRILRTRRTRRSVGTMRRVRGALNPSLDIEGVLLTMSDDRTNLGQLVARDVRDFFKDKVFQHDHSAQRQARRGAEPWHARSSCDTKVARCRCYIALAKEMLSRARGVMSGVQRNQVSGVRGGIDARTTTGSRKGLSALIPDAPEPARHGAVEVDIDLLAPNEKQPRVRWMTQSSTSSRGPSRKTASFSRFWCSGLAISIESSRASADGARAARRPSQGAGRRARHANRLGSSEVLQLALIENIQRENLNPARRSGCVPTRLAERIRFDARSDPRLRSAKTAARSLTTSGS